MPINSILYFFQPVIKKEEEIRIEIFCRRECIKSEKNLYFNEIYTVIRAPLVLQFMHITVVYTWMVENGEGKSLLSVASLPEKNRKAPRDKNQRISCQNGINLFCRIDTENHL